MMTHKASHGKQMAQHLHPYKPTPTIHKLPIEHLHQTNLNPEECKHYMKIINIPKELPDFTEHGLLKCLECFVSGKRSIPHEQVQ